jgi:hypothetical protein
MEERGHPVKLIFSSAKHTMMNVCKCVTEDANHCLKSEKKTQLTGEARTEFIANWLRDNKSLVNSQMGIEPPTGAPGEVLGEHNKYLTGILFTTAASILTIPQLQEGIQGNACHLQFGKYKLFSAYCSTAVGSMFPIIFGIMFGS